MQLLRSSILIVYDDTDRTEKLELKLINFGFSYAVPDGTSVTHTAPWDGSASSHEDGYITGVRSLVRLMKQLGGELAKEKYYV